MLTRWPLIVERNRPPRSLTRKQLLGAMGIVIWLVFIAMAIWESMDGQW